MSRHRRAPGLSRYLRRALARTLAVTGTAALLAVGGAGMAHIGSPDRPTALPSYEVTAPADTRVTRLLDRFDCSPTGFADGRTPASSIVRDARGRTEVVSFDEGWAVYLADGEDELVAVCLEPPPTR